VPQEDSEGNYRGKPMNNKHRVIDGVANRYSSNFEIEEDRVIIKDRGSKHKAQIIANKLHERGYTTFVNPLEEAHEVTVD
jgi:hypothetical protein